MPQHSSSDAIAKLLQRQHNQPWDFAQADDKLLVINPDGSALSFLNADAWCFHAGHASDWPLSYCQIQPPNLAHYAGVLLIVAKEHALNHYIVQQLAALPAGVPIWLAGENRGGINTLVKKFPASFCRVTKVASGNHCQLYQTTVLTQQPAANPSDYVEPIQIELSDLTFELISLPGVFSKQRLDEGTRLLLETLPKSLPTPILDFACGNGVIARALHQRQQPRLIACDVNPMAVAAANENLKDCDASVLLADGMPTLPEPVGCIVSNPPFHTGLRTDYTIAQRFIKAAYQQLKQGGSLYIVANRFLPWQEVIEQTFGHCHRHAENNKFVVYLASRQ